MDERTPPTKPSEEADRKQLKLASEEGDAYFKSLEYMASEVADSGATQHHGDMIVAYAQEKAEGMYHLKDGKLEWVEPPQDRNCHFEVTVVDAADHRFIPFLDITLTVTAEDGTEIGTEKMPFLWHPGLYHYGMNWALPGDGKYDLTIRVAAPTFPRHDKKNGKRYAEPVEAVFKGIEVKTGRG